MESQKKFIPRFSLNFFPSKTAEEKIKLRKTCKKLANRNSVYLSITFDAGRSMQSNAFKTEKEINETGITSGSHISCIGQAKIQICNTFQRYMIMGVNLIVLLRGKIPPGIDWSTVIDFHYINHFVVFLRKETGVHLCIEKTVYSECHLQVKCVLGYLLLFKARRTLAKIMPLYITPSTQLLLSRLSNTNRSFHNQEFVFYN